MEVFGKAGELIVSGDRDLYAIIFLSLRITITATIVASVLAIPLGAAIAIWKFPGRAVLRVLGTGMMALPPVVVGLVVYLMLSRSGPLGELGLLFTPSAMVIAQTILIFPIVMTLTTEAVAPLEREYRNLLLSLDTPWFIKLQTLIMDARFGIYTALLAGFGRALAEVGAVIVVGGNINGVTRVMTTTIALETSKGNLELALALGVVLIVIALITNALIHYIGSIGRRYQVLR